MPKKNSKTVQLSIQNSEKVPYVPFGYAIEGNTLYRIDGDDKIPVCDPLYIEAAARDDKGDNWGRLLIWNDQDGQRHEWAMPSAMLAADGAEYRRILLSQGLCIRAGRKAQNALHDYILSAAPKDRALSVANPGWHKGKYVMPDGTVCGDADEKVLLQVNGTLPKLEVSGNLEDWQSNVGALAVGNSRLAFMLSTALVGTLLYAGNEGPGGFHFPGGSSTGKTTGLRAAASVWGLSLRSWRTTDNAAESWARFAHDGFLPIDEIGQVDGRAADKMAYMLGNGQTKGRASRDGIARETAEFRLMFLSTGEIGLAEKLGEQNKKAKAGQAVRMIEIPADAGAGHGMFENLHGFASADEFAKHLSRMSQEYKGRIAPEFINRLTGMGLEKLQHVISRLTDKWLSDNVPDGADGQVTRAARRFALVAVAGELAASFGIFPWPDDEANKAATTCFKDWLKQRGGSGSFEVLDGLQSILQFIQRFGNSRFVNIEYPEEKVIDRAGFRRKGLNDEWEYMFFPDIFRNEVLDGNQNERTITKAAISSGLIEPDVAGKKTAKSVKLPGLGKKRMICVYPARYNAEIGDA